MSNLTQNDVLETGIEMNDLSDTSQGWYPLALYKASEQFYQMKFYIQKNFSVWKVTMTVLTIIGIIALLYIADTLAQLKDLRNVNGKKNS